jgi:hypothetical protein
MIVIKKVLNPKLGYLFGEMFPEGRLQPFTKEEVVSYAEENIGGGSSVFLVALDPPSRTLLGVACGEICMLPRCLYVTFFASKDKEATKLLVKKLVEFAKLKGLNRMAFTSPRNEDAMKRRFGGEVVGCVIMGTVEEALSKWI